jgi:hypothetical protein
LPRAVSQIVYPSNGTTVALWAIIALLLGHLAALARLLDRTATVPLALLATLVPMEIIVWDGEPSEVPRHGLLVGVSARLALIFLAAIACDNVLRRRNRGEPGASANAASMQRSTHSSSSVGQTVPPPFWVRAIRGTRPSLPNGKPLTQVGEFGARSRATVSLSPVDRIIRHRACSAASLC